MPSINITWNLCTYKTTVDVTTLVSDIISDSLRYFKLSGKSEQYALKVHGKPSPIDSTLSLRFINLPQGAHLELVYNGDKLNSNLENDSMSITEIVKIRTTFVDTICGTTKNSIGNYDPSTSIADLVATVTGMDLRDTIYKGLNWRVHTMTRVVEISESDIEISLADLGLRVGNHAIRVVVGKAEDPSNKKVKNGNNKIVNWGKKVLKEVKKDAVEEKPKGNVVGSIMLTPHAVVAKEMDVDKVSADKVGKVSADKVDKVDKVDDDAILESETESESEPESDIAPTIAQARKYQEMLSRRAAEEPMLTRALRDKLAQEEAEAKERRVAQIRNLTSDVEIKVVFPNNKAVLFKIDKGHTLDELKRVLDNKVITNEAKRACSAYNNMNKQDDFSFYTLQTGHPDKVVILGNKVDPSLSNCKLGEEPLASLLGNRITLYFTVDLEYRAVLANIPIVRPNMIDEVAQTTGRGNTTPTSTPTSTPAPTITNTTANTNTNTIKSKTLKKLPKWVKLGKK